MNDQRSVFFDELIQNRRSIRKYKTDLPSKTIIEQVIQTACLAPSPSNTQPVRFVNIASQSIRDEMLLQMKEGRDRFLAAAEKCDNRKRLRNLINTYFRYSVWMFNAPVMLAAGVLKESSGFSKKLFETGLMESYDLKDPDITVGLSLSSVILKGESLGLGSCVLTAPLVFMQEKNVIPGVEDLSLRCFLIIGYPDEKPAPVERKTVRDIYSVV